MTDKNVEYFNDIEYEIKKLGCVASLVVKEAYTMSKQFDESLYPSFLQVLTALVAARLNPDAIEDSYKKRMADLKLQEEKERQTAEIEKIAEEGKRKFYANNSTAYQGTGY